MNLEFDPVNKPKHDEPKGFISHMVLMISAGVFIHYAYETMRIIFN